MDAKFRHRLAEALSQVRDLEASIGTTRAEVQQKQAAKANLDRTLLPFRVIAAAWTGGVMLGPEACDEDAYNELVKHVGATGAMPDAVLSERLREMIACGFGLGRLSDTEINRAALTPAVGTSPPLPYDLVFPEVFHPTGAPFDRRGFDVVFGNPPWERPEIDPQEFFCNFDFRVLALPSGKERDEIIDSLCSDPGVASTWKRVTGETAETGRILEALYVHQQVEVDGKLTLGRPDLFRLFAERGHSLLANGGRVGWVLPSSFHNNEGATGVRRLYLDQMDLHCCYSFENQKALFEIHRSTKFALVIATRGRSTVTFNAAFYLHDDEWLFNRDRRCREVRFDRELLRTTGGTHLTLVEAQTQDDLELAAVLVKSKRCTWADLLAEGRIRTAFGVELHRNPAFNRRLPGHASTPQVYEDARRAGWQILPLHAGKTIHQFTDVYDAPPANFVQTQDAIATRHWLRSVPYFRFGFRMKARSTDERTLIAALITPGFVCEQTLAIETTPGERPNHFALFVTGLCNTFVFDWQVRQRVTSSLSNYLLAPIPVAGFDWQRAFIAHGVLRLCCNHAGFQTIWQEQTCRTWREIGKQPYTWPVLADEDERLEVRAVIDAVAAEAYGLSHQQYEHVLSTFSHRSWPKAPALCLGKFDELKRLGSERFSRKYDLYHDVPLVESLPVPVIDLAAPALAQDQGTLPGMSAASAPKQPRRRGTRQLPQPSVASHGSIIDPTLKVTPDQRAVAAIAIAIVFHDTGKSAQLYESAIRCALNPAQLGKALAKPEQQKMLQLLKALSRQVGTKLPKLLDPLQLRQVLEGSRAVLISGVGKAEIWSSGPRLDEARRELGDIPEGLAALLMKAATAMHDVGVDLFAAVADTEDAVRDRRQHK